jgi:outer membrane protein OmpA-like peptidoglycan-associated protein
MDDIQSTPPEDVVKPPEDSSSLLEEIDLLAALPKDVPIDIKPEIMEPEFALTMKKPAMEGDPAAVAMDVSAGLEIDLNVPDLGREPERIKPAEIGQVTVDPGAVQVDDDKLGKFTDELIKRGANGKVEKGALDGIASLDDLLDLPPNILLSKKTMLPSDLLFEFNSSELRDSAKVGLMKIALLMDRNPGMHCWVEGHTDLVGGDDFNLNLSIRRAESVKDYLVASLRMDAGRIHTRGFGRYEPLVITGDNDGQAINRRVEIRMRNTPPTREQLKVTPQKATVIPEEPPPPATPVDQTPPAPKAVLVKPKRALPVEDSTDTLPVPDPLPPRASPVEDPVKPLPPVPRAQPIDEPPPPLRAEPVVQ